MAATAMIRETMLQCHMHLCPNCCVVTPSKMGAELNNNTQLQQLGLGVSHLNTLQGNRGLTSENRMVPRDILRVWLLLP